MVLTYFYVLALHWDTNELNYVTQWCEMNVNIYRLRQIVKLTNPTWFVLACPLGTVALGELGVVTLPPPGGKLVTTVVAELSLYSQLYISALLIFCHSTFL